MMHPKAVDFVTAWWMGCTFPSFQGKDDDHLVQMEPLLSEQLSYNSCQRPCSQIQNLYFVMSIYVAVLS
jgi:hypothetical protein